MREVAIKTEYIKLSQLLKLAGIIGNGAEAKGLVNDAQVSVNGLTVNQRNKKVYPNDILTVNGQDPVKVKRESVCT